MKKLSIICSLLMVFGLMSVDAFGSAKYCKDYLEGGNAGGWAGVTKSMDTEVILMESATVEVDIWINAIRTSDTLVSGGFWLPFISPSIEILDVTIYDSGTGGATYSSAPGPWDPSMTVVDVDGAVEVIVGSLSGAAHDGSNDVIVGKLTVHCLAFGDDALVVIPIGGFDTVVSMVDGYIYDPEMLADAYVSPTFYFRQTKCCDVNADCDDGIYCNGAEYCDTDTSGLCTTPPETGMCRRAAADVDCDDAIDCTDDSCNEDTDGCDNIANDALCVDAYTCSDDACDQLGAPGTGCSNTPNDANCSDANVCTDDNCTMAAPGSGCENPANSDPCDDGVYCNGDDTCGGGTCSLHAGNPCDDANACTTDDCDEPGDPGACTNDCIADSPVNPCCSDAECEMEDICQAGGVIYIGDDWANCGDVGIKIPICLENINDPIGGFQIDLCEDIDDCLECVECELTERTAMFDCVVNELANGCCRLIVFGKHPGALINPGDCDIVIVVFKIKDLPMCCDTCIEIDGENIILADEYGYNIVGVIGPDGEGSVCPYVCGDIEPAESAPGAMDCGDGDVDIFDILEEVAFALDTKDPDACQGAEPDLGPRDDVPTGTPPYCIAPDGVINILDIMVLIDMALDRQDCCTYYYTGGIF